MPIKSENKKLYPKNWPAISRAIKEVAGWKCQQCGLAQYEVIARGKKQTCDEGTFMRPAKGEVHCQETGEFLGYAKGSEYRYGKIRVVLTTAHLNHNPTDCREENLKSLCQLHHLKLDLEHHKKN